MNLKQAPTYFPKIQEPSRNSKHQTGDTKQFHTVDPLILSAAVQN